MDRTDIVERRIDDRRWLESGNACKAPVHEAIWCNSRDGWQWPEQVKQIYGSASRRIAKTLV